jgi:hypothetical protein
MPNKSEKQTLFLTLKNEGCIPDSLKTFRKFLREKDDTADEDNDQVDSVLQGDCEMMLQFILDVQTLEHDKIGSKYFSEDSKMYRLALTNNSLRKELCTILQANSSTPQVEKNDKLKLAEEDILHQLSNDHESWICELFDKKILEHRSGTTFFTGWLVDSQ